MAKRGQLELLPPVLVDPNRKRLGTFVEDSKGRRRLGGRWNLYRVAEFLQGKPTWQTVDDLAYFVYGTRTPTTRDNVRKHVPAQRRYMLNSLEIPIVTRYGERGRIMAIKIYRNNSGSEEDRALLRMDLDRLRERNEITQQRYDNLLRIFLLESPPA
jgi:hypothetical protein